MMYEAFTLVLMVNHGCNLRCSYCYTGAKFTRAMPEKVAQAAVERALASLRPQGRLELGFFGGEPLLESPLISAVIRCAREKAAKANVELIPSLTTNGTCTDPSAWEIMTDPAIELSVSHDGLPALHDRHRVTPLGGGTSKTVDATLQRLVEVGREFNVVMVVRPDTVESLSRGVRYLRDLGVRRVEPSLDLWTTWTAKDVFRLRSSIDECATLWRDGLPDYSFTWFDEKLAQVASVPTNPTARCGFGEGQIAVAPSGRLYPCERLIGEDPQGHPLRLPGNALEGSDFLSCRRPSEPPPKSPPAGSGNPACGTTCRCSNFVRTGTTYTPDELISSFDRMCAEATIRALDLVIPEKRCASV